MISLEQIKAPIAKEYEEFKKLFSSVFETEIQQYAGAFSDNFIANEALLNRVIKYI